MGLFNVVGAVAVACDQPHDRDVEQTREHLNAVGTGFALVCFPRLNCVEWHAEFFAQGGFAQAFGLAGRLKAVAERCG